MGYYTNHELEIVEGDSTTIDHEKGISEMSNYDNCFQDEIKWYDHENVMREYSKKFPDTLFKLIGEGEENGDLWHEYYKNGEMQKCIGVTSYEEYNPNALS